MGEDAVILLSGGQDSTTCLFWAKEKFNEVTALSFYYGQNHAAELSRAKKAARKADVGHEIKTLVVDDKNALTSDKEISEEGEYPNTFVPGRNLIFLTHAGILAYRKEYENIVIGVSQVDYSGYPDCRKDTITAMGSALSHGLARDLTIHTPLIERDKAETFKLADDLGILDYVKNNTLTCYNGNDCGECPACKLRENGLQEYKKRFMR